MPTMQVNEEFLEHYGVKGMKWGVRKKPEYKDRKSIQSMWLTQKGLQKQNLRVLKKGDTTHHVSGDPNLKLKSGGLYVSYLEKDAEVYRDMFSHFVSVTKGVDKVYEYDLKVVEDIITPTKKEKINTFIDMHRGKTSEQLISNLAESKMQGSIMLGIARYIGLGKNQKADLTKKYRDLINSDNPRKQQKAFDSFVEFLVLNPKERKQYLNLLAKKGFTGMYDDLDMKNMFSAEPLIIFNPEKSLKVTTKREV